jgi:hypothetical protein
MCQRKTRRSVAALLAVTIATGVAGCSGLYVERQDAIALSAGDAVAANKMAQIYSPWPAGSNKINYAANGQKMQSAVERYRTGRVIPPINPTTSDVENQMQTQAALAAQNSSQGNSGANVPVPTAVTSVGNPSGQ